MTVHDSDHPVDLRLRHSEFDLVLVALRHLLASEDDAQTIEELEVLIARLARAVEQEPA